MNNKTLVEGLEPLIHAESRILILGTMPGELSLERKQYYSNSRNQFWRIMDNLIQGISDAMYEEKVKMLNECGISLWDVIRKCERKGSLDTKISDTTMVFNDFQKLFDEYNNLRTVFFNGKSKKSSYRLFKKYVEPVLSPQTKQSLILMPLPSSSAANTHQNLEGKVQDWMKIQQYLTC